MKDLILEHVNLIHGSAMVFGIVVVSFHGIPKRMLTSRICPALLRWWGSRVEKVTFVRHVNSSNVQQCSFGSLFKFPPSSTISMCFINISSARSSLTSTSVFVFSPLNWSLLIFKLVVYGCIYLFNNTKIILKD